MNIAICDDNPKICEQVTDILTDYSRKTNMELHIDTCISGDELLCSINKGKAYNLIYLDIEMNHTNGIEVGQYIRKTQKDYTTEIVYISGKEGYERQLFDVQPLNFIAKPILESEIIKNLNLAVEKTNKNNRSFQFKKQNDTYIIPIRDIIYFEGQGRKIKIVTTKDTFDFYDSLDSVEQRLHDHQFIRIHKSFLVNYRHIMILRYKEVITTNEINLPVSRSKQNAIRELQTNLL